MNDIVSNLHLQVFLCEVRDTAIITTQFNLQFIHLQLIQVLQLFLAQFLINTGFHNKFGNLVVPPSLSFRLCHVIIIADVIIAVILVITYLFTFSSSFWSCLFGCRFFGRFFLVLIVFFFRVVIVFIVLIVFEKPLLSSSDLLWLSCCFLLSSSLYLLFFFFFAIGIFGFRFGFGFGFRFGLGFGFCLGVLFLLFCDSFWLPGSLLFALRVIQWMG